MIVVGEFHVKVDAQTLWANGVVIVKGPHCQECLYSPRPIVLPDYLP